MLSNKSLNRPGGWAQNQKLNGVAAAAWNRAAELRRNPLKKWLELTPMSHTRDTPLPEQNIAVIGDSGVGKTSLVRALLGDKFDFNPPATHGIDAVSVEGFAGARLIAFGGGTRREDMIAQLHQIQPVAAIVVVDSRVAGSTSNVDPWCSLLTTYATHDGPEKFLVVSRSDIGSGEVDVNGLVEKYGFSGVYRTSAKDRTGIQELRTAVRNAVIALGDDEEEVGLGDVVTVVRVMAEHLCELVAKNADALMDIEWRDLERLLARALEEVGFSVELTPPAKDGGKDIIADCVVEKQKQVFYIEIKHWRSGGRPGEKHVADFVSVNARDGTHGGLLVSSSGFTDPVYARLGELSRQRIRLGQQETIVSLCQHYVKKRGGLWHCQTPLPELLFEHTLN